MNSKNLIIIISILLNLALTTYVYLKVNHLTDVYSNLSIGLQSDLVQLESAIEYQNENNWKEADNIIEKIEDVKESINYLLVTGKDTGLITKTQESDLWKLSSYFLNYPTYTGSSNIKLDSNNINELKELGDDLKSAGWEMNKGYSGDWESLSMKISTLIK
ncbi:hypothetical protein [Paenibacillus sp. YAF4_2]|uniref:hypothetical protein n=1 Tax=Paenibacillus sp. YAF4_2 TaxID=3233085 RepID=UPI003F9D9151